MAKRLYRSRVNYKIAGVCSGLGEYFRVDPTIIRIITILLVFADGAGLIGYIIAWIVMPKRPLEAEGEVTDTAYAPLNKYLPGIILVAVGAILLVGNIWWWFEWHDLWPLVLIAVGILLLVNNGRKEARSEKESSSQEITP